MGIEYNNFSKTGNGFFEENESLFPSNGNTYSDRKDTYESDVFSEDVSAFCNKLFRDLGKLLLSDLNDIFDNVLCSIEKKINRKLNFEEYIELISSMIDERIIKTQTDQEIRFISGKMHIKINNERKQLEFKVESYYQNAMKQWIKQESKGHTILSRFDESAYPQLREIYKNGELVLDIDPPQ